MGTRISPWRSSSTPSRRASATWRAATGTRLRSGRVHWHCLYFPSSSTRLPFSGAFLALNQWDCGQYSTWEVTGTGQLYNWGASACGQLGHSDTENMPKDVEGYPSAGGLHGTVECAQDRS